MRRASRVLPYMGDVVEYDEEDGEIDRSRPDRIALPPPVMGGSAWVFS